MLSKEDNERLTRIGRGTSMGELWRRFWIPGLLGAELRRGGSPVRFKLLGESLLGFRQPDGKIGVLEERCPHRGASLFFGRNDDEGIRCVYHGWKFAIDGRCLDIPNEEKGCKLQSSVRAIAYPVREWGGLVWVYLGPSERLPELPLFDWCTVPDTHRSVTKWAVECNYAQGLEGDLDASHVGILHRWFDMSATNAYVKNDLIARDNSPVLTVRDVPSGVLNAARRSQADDTYFWRVTRFLPPCFSLVPRRGSAGGRAWVPIDDTHTWVFGYHYNTERPLREEEHESLKPGGSLGTPLLIDGTFRSTANSENDYFIDREMQQTVNYTGIADPRVQDMAVTESMGSIVDRTREHLGASDQFVIRSRRLLLRLCRQLEEGQEPEAALRPELYRARPVEAFGSPIACFEPLMDSLGFSPSE